MKEKTKHGGMRGDNFGPKGGAVKLDEVFVGEKKIRDVLASLESVGLNFCLRQTYRSVRGWKL